MVITGEGSIDEQTLQGKGPFGVAKRAKEFSLPVIAFAGRVPLLLINHPNNISIALFQ
jgi:glycerate kinase